MAPLHRDKTKVYLEQTSTYFGSNTNTPAVITDGVVPAPKKPRKWLWVLLAVLCVAVCVFIGWYLGQGGGGKRQPTVTSTPTTIPVTPSDPPAPTIRANILNLKATDHTSTLGYVSLTWEAAGRSDVMYTIYRTEANANSYDMLATTSNTWYDDVTCLGGTGYVYRVIASVGGIEHASADAYVTTTHVPVSASSTPIPSHPTKLPDADSSIHDTLPKATPTPTTKASISHLIITDCSSSLGYISLSWEGAGRTDVSYAIYRRESSSGVFTLLSTTENTWYYDRSYTAGMYYNYKVTAFVHGTEHASMQQSITVATSPTPTPTARATISHLIITDYSSSLGYISLNWEGAGRADVSYAIYRRESSSGVFKLLSTTENAWYYDRSYTAGMYYNYKVTAFVHGTEHASMQQSITVATPPTPTPTARATISHLIITDYSSSLGYISLNWEGAGRADVSYAIYRRESSSGVFKLLSTTENTWYYDRSYTAGMYYNYKVTAFVHGTEHASMQQSITVATPPTPTPTARATISHLIITDYSSSLGYVSLNWDGAGRTDVSYDIYRRERSSDAFTLLATTENTWYYDRSYTAGTTCYYQVVAVVSGSEHSSVEAHVTIAPRTTATTRKTTPTPQREGVLSSIFSAQVGDYITFGRYEQDANHSNGKESIEWLVLDKQNNRLLVISRYGLDCQLYSQNYYQVKHFVTWETSTLRKWLNNDFIKAAFSSTEQTRIPTVTVSADTNPFYDSDPGNSTKDKIFLLSISESKRYFAHDKARGCQPTAYARQQGAAINNKGMCWWWLRTPGYSSTHVSFVGDTGGLFESGNIASDNDHAIRPAMWIALDP